MKKKSTIDILMLALFIGSFIQVKAQWEYLAPMPTPRALCTASVLDGKIYVIGGTSHPDSMATTDVKVFDPIIGDWLPNAPDLPVPLCAATSNVVDGKIYVIGGDTYQTEFSNSLYEFNPVGGGTWTKKANMLISRFFHASVVLDDKIYVMGGRSQYLPASPEKSVEMYDPDTGIWTRMPDMKVARVVFSANVVDGKIYVMGGAESPDSVLLSAEVYDTLIQKWTLLENMPQGRVFHGTAVINDTILVYGGTTGTSWLGIWKFDPLQSAKWSDVGGNVIPEQIAWFADAVVEGANCKKCIYTFGGGYESFVFYPYLGPPTVTNAVLKYCPPQQFEISGGPVSGTWKYTCSPYMINGDIWVADGKTLLIEPGVKVIFNEHYRFDIQGQLLAVGTKDSIITFTAQDSVTAWNGLRLIDIPVTNDTSKLIYCKVQYGFPSGPTFEDNRGGGVAVYSVDKLIIASCEITGNRTEGDLFSGGGGIAISDCSPLITRNLISNNIALGGHGGGIAIVNNANPVITNNAIFNNTATLGGVEGGGGGGIAISQCDPVLINNTITGNNAEHGGGVDFVFGTGTHINTIIYGNSATSVGDQVHLGGEYNAGFLYCNIEGGFAAFAQDHEAGCPDHAGRYENNIDADPDFLNISLCDFHLSAASPCIGAGTDSIELDGIWYQAPTTDFYGYSRPRPVGCSPDIGAIENDICIKSHWSYQAPLPTSRALSTASVLDDKIYVIGGLSHPDSMATSEVNVYNWKMDNWLPNAPDLPMPLCGATSNVLGEKIYVIGGDPYIYEFSNSLYEYDPTGGSTWAKKANMPSARFFHTSVVLDDKIYVMGGRSQYLPSPPEKSVEMFDPNTNRWTQVKDMNVSRQLFSAKVVDGKIYAMGGAVSIDSVLHSVEVYDPQANTWTELDNMPDARVFHGSAVKNDTILVFGGVSSDWEPPLNIWQFDPLQSDTWSEIEGTVMPDQILWFSDAAIKITSELCLYTFGGGYESFLLYPLLPRPFITDAVYKFCLPINITTTKTFSNTSAPLSLFQNYPNPFSSKTTIKYELSNSSKVCIKVFNIAGQEVAIPFEGFKLSGEHKIEWKTDGLASGVYFYRLQTDTGIVTRKCIAQK